MDNRLSDALFEAYNLLVDRLSPDNIGELSPGSIEINLTTQQITLTGFKPLPRKTDNALSS